MSPRSAWLMAAVIGATAVPLMPGAEVAAQVDLRSSFPGRRVGGGTRGECNARLLVHLVPESNVYAPGSGVTVGLVEGPTSNPYPLQLSFRLQSGGGVTTRTLPVSGPGVTLVTLPSVKAATVWESGYLCGDSGSASADPLSFVSASSPPALSLLVADPTLEDRSVASHLQALRRFCGRSVSKLELARNFGIDELKTADWPEQLPVRCPS